MANGIGSVWAANYGEDGKPNGVGSVWIANASALVPSGGATEEQVSALSAAIDYVSANAGDPNALTGYQTSGVEISATDSLFEVSGMTYDLKVDDDLTFKKGNKNIRLGGLDDFTLNTSAAYYSAWIDYNGIYGFSASDYMGSFGGWNEYSTPPANHYPGGVGFSGTYSKFGVFNGGELKVFNSGKLSAMNSCSAIFTNGSRIELTNSTDVGLSGSQIAMNAGELYFGNNVLRAGQRATLNASGSRFVSADGEGVSAWVAAPMTVFGIYNQTSSNAAFVIGDGNVSTRSDLFVIDYSGNAKSNDFVANNGAKLSDLTAMSAAIGDVESLLSSL